MWYKAHFIDHRNLTQSETLYIIMYYHLSEESEVQNGPKGGNWITTVHSLHVTMLEVDIMLFCADDLWHYTLEP